VKVWGAVFLLAIIPAADWTAAAQAPQAASPAPQMPMSQTTTPPPATALAAPQMLTLQDAERIAIQNHPRIHAAIATAAAAKAEVVQQRAAYYPTVTGDATGVDAENNSRLSAGALNSPRVFEKYANGIDISQLITDFGRTHELVKSSDLNRKAADEDVVTSREDVLLNVDQAYYGVLKAQAVLKVAQETVKERQTVSDQVTTLEQNKIKSGLDVSFANVNLAQSQLLLIQAQNGLDASYAQLSAALGYPNQRTFQLADVPLPAAPPPFAGLLQQAFQNRPELLSQRLRANAAHTYALAERDLWFPTLTAAGAAGLAPYMPTTVGLDSPRYAAAGFNLNIPIFNGHLYGALRNQANEQARAEDDYLLDLEDRISRDVRMAWLNANSAFQRLAVTQQLLNEANLALQLSQSRYKLGLSSIVELTQAQLNQTQAQIDWASARYDYQTTISVLNFQLGNLR
jgi:outer membrane protein